MPVLNNAMTSLSRIFRRLRPSLRTQIALLGIVGVITTGALSLAGLNYAAHVQTKSDLATRFSARLASLSEGFLESQQLAAEFLRKPDEASIDKHKEGIKNQLADLDQIQSYVAGLPEGDPLKDVAFLGTGVNLYTTRFHNVVSAQRVLGLNENEGLQGKLRNAIRELETRLAQLDQPRLTMLMLMMRQHEKDFMLRHDEKYGDELTKRVSDFEAALGASNLTADVRAELKKLVDAYRASFSAFLVSQQAQDDQVDDLGQIYGRNRPILMKAITIADARAVAATERASRFREVLRWGIGLCTLAIGLIAILVGQRITRLITRMTSAMRELADGQFEITLPGLGRSDEIGEMARAVETFKIRANEKAEAELEARIDQDRLLEVRRKADLATLASSFEAAVGGVIATLSSASTELESSARSLTGTAHDTQEFSAKVASASEDASRNVQLVAAATEQMMASVSEIGRQVEESAAIAKEAVLQAEQTDQRMKRLSEAAQKVGRVVELITTIAQQTNLLALNATIEAARAGDAGRGFAVVAHEVKSLATQTANATSEIGEQVAGIQAATRESADALTGIGDFIGRISQIASSIAVSIEQQGAATKDIAQNIQHAAKMTTQVAGNVRQVASSALKTDAASSELLTSANTLAQSSDHLQQEVDRFLVGIRV